ncbi:MAG TPA: ATP-grasp domain-containing protein [Planctomycetaceae bacterium]|nr:ATP-grasp domain-containing protein [Planctomycetaceae bacterium]
MSSSSLLPPAGLDPRPRLLIVGCSTRAAAWSAVRAGFRPVCADQFGDEDLRMVAEVVPDAMRDSMGTGGSPRVVAAAHLRLHNITSKMWCVASTDHGRKRLAAQRKLIGPCLGVSPDSDELPFLGITISNALMVAGLPYVRFMTPKRWERATPSGKWLLKPFDSGGGRQIRFWSLNTDPIPSGDDHYVQEYKPGRPMSAIFIGRDNGIQLLGLTQQLIGDPVASPPWPFGYCGNIAPVSLPEAGQEMIERMAEAIAARVELRGLFGLDFIWDGATPWVCEVNPRYTASCELLELAYGQPLLTEHWSCFTSDPPPTLPGATGGGFRPPVLLPSSGEDTGGSKLPPLAPRVGGLPDMVGKLILYARRTVTAPDLSQFLSPRSPWTVPFLADVPRVGTMFEPGQPLCTVFATGGNADAVRQKLDRRVARVRRWFGDAESP